MGGLPTRSGAIALLAIFVTGGVLLLGIRLTRHARPRTAPPGVPWGVPGRTLRIISHDLRRQNPQSDPMLAAMSRLNPDYVLLQDVEEDDVVPIAQLLGMQQSFHAELFQRSMNLVGRRVTYGNCIFSKHPLYEGAPLTGGQGPFGAWAVSVMDGRKFLVASVHFAPGERGIAEAHAMTQVWQARGAPPMVAGVLPSDTLPAPIRQDYAVITPVAGEWIVLTREWKSQGTPPASQPAGGSSRIWMDIVAR